MSNQRDGSGQQGALSLLLTLATIVATASLLVREITDADTWWQVAIGRDILTHLAVPRIDHFAAAAYGRSYHDSHWLFQVVVALFDRLGGMKGVGVFTVMIWSATLLCCYRSVRVWLPHAASCLVVFVVVMACNERFTPRPDSVTCFMIAIFYSRLQLRKYGTIPETALLSFLQVVWSNSHGLFVIGPFMAGCYLLAAALRRWSGEEVELSSTVKLFAVLSIASLVTPYGLDGWRYAMLLVKEAGPHSSVLFKTLEELSPTFGATARSYPDFWFFLTLLIAAVTSSVPMIKHRRVPYSRLFVVMALFIAATSGRRNIPLFALTAAPFIAENIGRSWKRLLFSPSVKAALALLLLGFSWLPFSGRYYQLLDYPERFGFGAQPSSFPSGLPTYLHKINFKGQLYNHDTLGGFCLYHGFLPLVDGRWEVYDESVLKKILAAPFDDDAWEWLVATYHINGVILQNGREQTVALIPKLRKGRKFKMVYADDYSSFWLLNDRSKPEE
ncbi:MAG TPA: hypothetical protein VIU41_08340 [Geobacteraceae bacterium]